MAASEVYYMNARSESPQTGLVAKMLTVFEAAGLDQKLKELKGERHALVDEF